MQQTTLSLSYRTCYLLKTLSTSLALYLATLSSILYLIMYNYLFPTACWSTCLRTNVHVLFLIKASYSSIMAYNHLKSLKASCTISNSLWMRVVVYTFGLKAPTLLMVIILYMFYCGWEWICGLIDGRLGEIRFWGSDWLCIGSLVDAYVCESKILLVVPYCQPRLASYCSRKNEWYTCWGVIDCEKWELDFVWLWNVDFVAYGNLNPSK